MPRALMAFLFLAVAPRVAAQAADPRGKPVELPGYEYREAHDRNGIGKFYLGREIARVMGHEAADWLERPERQQEERPDLFIQELRLRPGDVVADIGAGSGYYSWRAAQSVGTSGLVYAVDIQQEMLDILAQRMTDRNVANVKGVLGTATDPKLPPASVDVVLLVDVYHEFDHPYEMMKTICDALKPGGRIVFAEFRSEDPRVPIKEVHKMSEEQLRKEMSVQPLTWLSTSEVLPWQHLIQFRKNTQAGEGVEKRSALTNSTSVQEKIQTRESGVAPATKP